MDMITGLSRQVWAAIGVGVFIAALFFKLIFGDFQGFVEGVRYWLQTILYSAVRGEWTEKEWGALKLFVWIALSVGCGLLAYYQIPHWLPGFFG
jgi:hypothetical protein